MKQRNAGPNHWMGSPGGKQRLCFPAKQAFSWPVKLISSLLLSLLLTGLIAAYPLPWPGWSCFCRETTGPAGVIKRYRPQKNAGAGVRFHRLLAFRLTFKIGSGCRRLSVQEWFPINHSWKDKRGATSFRGVGWEHNFKYGVTWNAAASLLFDKDFETSKNTSIYAIIFIRKWRNINPCLQEARQQKWVG